LVERFRKEWLANYLPKGADGQVERAAGRFALVGAAAELATSIGVLPWARGDAARAAAVCFKAWLQRRGGVEAAEITEGMAQVRAFLEKHGASRFEPLMSRNGQNAPSNMPPVIPFALEPSRIINQAGFREGDDDGLWTYYVTAEIWRREVCAGFDPGTIAKVLIDRGTMLRDAGRNTKTIRVPGRGTLRVYAIAPHFLNSGAE